MRTDFLNPKKLLELTLTQRVCHMLVFFGVPFMAWECFDLRREFQHNPFLGTWAVLSGVGLALLGGLVTALVAALIEHALVVPFRRRQRHQTQSRL
jgi:hypothetical protein